MDNLKSLSTQNLVKIIPKEDSSEENKNVKKEKRKIEKI